MIIDLPPQVENLTSPDYKLVLRASGEVELEVWRDAKELDHLRPWRNVVEGILGQPGVEGWAVEDRRDLTMVVKRKSTGATEGPVWQARFNCKLGRLQGLQPPRAELDEICRGERFSWGLCDAQDAASTQPKQLVLWLHG